MFCDECGSPMQWRCTDTRTNIAKYKCPDCGRVQKAPDDYKEPVVEVRDIKNYYFNRNRFIVRRVVDGKHCYIGCYGNEDTAKKVVEKMDEYDWDKSMVPQVYEELNIKKVNKSWVAV